MGSLIAKKITAKANKAIAALLRWLAMLKV